MVTLFHCQQLPFFQWLSSALYCRQLTADNFLDNCLVNLLLVSFTMLHCGRPQYHTKLVRKSIRRVLDLLFYPPSLLILLILVEI